MNRVSKEPDQRRSELIQCAQRFFYAKGYENTSISDIVNDLGLAKGTFYYYFDSKQAILEALIARLVGQSISILQRIADDDSLAAIPKLVRVYNTIGHWKTEQRDQVMAALQALYRQENFVLFHRLRDESIAMAVPAIANIIQQGIEEGVFTTQYARESAEIFLQTTSAFSEAFAQVLLNQQAYDNPIETVKRKKAATEAAIERILGAPPGSLPIFDSSIIDTWLA